MSDNPTPQPTYQELEYICQRLELRNARLGEQAEEHLKVVDMLDKARERNKALKGIVTSQSQVIEILTVWKDLEQILEPPRFFTDLTMALDRAGWLGRFAEVKNPLQIAVVAIEMQHARIEELEAANHYSVTGGIDDAVLYKCEHCGRVSNYFPGCACEEPED